MYLKTSCFLVVVFMVGVKSENYQDNADSPYSKRPDNNLKARAKILYQLLKGAVLKQKLNNGAAKEDGVNVKPQFLQSLRGLGRFENPILGAPNPTEPRKNLAFNKFRYICSVYYSRYC